MSDPSILLVPIRLDAWYLPASQHIFPLANFARQPYFEGVNPNWPNLSDELLAQPPKSAETLYRDSFPAPTVAGLQLHWALPDALTVGHTRQGKTEFPAVPDRWLITRRERNRPLRQWVVESDYLHPAEPDANSGRLTWRNAITFPVTPPHWTQGATALPSCRYMGRVMPFDQWQKTKAAADEYLPQHSRFPLTAVGYGDPIFAAYYPNCFSVFGFADSSVTGDGTYVYDVIGWYGDAKEDCLRRFAGEPDPFAALRHEYHWILPSHGVSERKDNAREPEPFPTLTVCYARLRVIPGQVAGKMMPSATVRLAVGNTGTEALSAYLAHQIDAQRPAILEDQLEALSLSAHLRGTGVDFGMRYREARHQKQFRSLAGGTLWAVAERSTATAKTAAGRRRSSREVTLPPQLADQLDGLNRLQQACDTTRNEIVSAQRRLFGEWWKYMYFKKSSTQGIQLKLPCIERFIEGTSVPYLEERNAVLQGLTALFMEAQGALARALAGLNQTAAAKDAKVELQLLSKPAPRYWQPRDPVVLIAGEAAVSTPRHGEDAGTTPGGLPCAGFTLTGPGQALPTDHGLIPKHFQQILAAVDGVLQGDPTQPFVGYQHQTAPPWHPILLEWQVTVWPNVNETLPWPSPGDALFRAFRSDYIAKSYRLAENSSDLETVKSDDGTENPYYGRSILTPHAPRQMRYDIETYLLQLTLLDCWPENLQTGDLKTYGPRLVTWYEAKLGHQPSAAAPQTSDPDYERDFTAWCREQHPFRHDGTGKLLPWSTLAAQYPGKPVAGGKAVRDLPALEQARDPVYTAIRAHGRLDGLNALSQSLGGFNEALLSRFQQLQVPIGEPEKKREPALTKTVRTLVGSQNLTEPRDAFSFQPIRSGRAKPTDLHLVDTFGQRLKLNWQAPDVSAVLADPSHPGCARFPPRLTQPARLELRWLAAGRNGMEMEMNSHPATTPVAGWLVPNNLDDSLMVYDGGGDALGSILATAAWEPAPGAGPRLAAEDIPNPHLRRLVAALYAAPGTNPLRRQRFLANLLTALDSGLENIEPQSFAQHEALALLIGRPIAVVRASVALRLAGLPAVNESWSVFELDLDQLFGGKGSADHPDCCLCKPVPIDDYAACRTSNNFTNVRFPVRIGEHEQLDDGVVGYWIEDGDGYRDATFYAPQSVPNPDPQIRTEAEGPINLRLAPGDAPLALTLLIDPRGTVHATSGILPAKVLDVPPDQYAPVLQKIAVTFLTAPLLTDGERVHLPLPGEPGYQWSWLTRPDGAAWRETFDLAATSTHPVSGATPKLVEGWLKLKPRKA